MDTLERREDRPRGLRAEIELSWRRVKLGGLRPDMPVDRLTVAEIDQSSRLMVAAKPVLREMAEQLTGTRYCVLLADRECRIVDRWFDTPEVERALEGISAVPGCYFAEEAIGTNGLGTPMEVRRGIVVHGDEHFNEALKTFSCYGHPIRHPLTGRIEGVLDLTGITTDANPLFAPFLARAARDIERRMLDGARLSERRLLDAFQRAVHRRARPVAVLGHDAVLTNKAAIDLLDPSDHATLRSLAEGRAARQAWTRQIRLASGALVDVRAERIAGTDGGTLFQLDPVARPQLPVPRGLPVEAASRLDSRLRSLRIDGGPILIAGEPGTGRTSAVRTIAGARELTTLPAADVLATGEQAWAERFLTAVDDTGSAVAVEELHLLPETLCVLVATTIAARPTAPIMLTTAPLDQIPAVAAGVAACCQAQLELQPLRNRIDELARLVREVLAEIHPGGKVRLAASALESLAGQPWPGNLRELSIVLRRVVAVRSAGDVTVADLPEAYRGTPRAARLAGRERAERAAIIEALDATQGNKARAATRLGISRTTLYSRMKALGVTG